MTKAEERLRATLGIDPAGNDATELAANRLERITQMNGRIRELETVLIRRIEREPDPEDETLP